MVESLLLGAGLIATPLAVTIAFGRLDGRVSARRWQAFGRQLAGMGLHLRPGSTPTTWQADGLLDGVPISIEPFQMRAGKGHVRRTAVRVTQPVQLADAAVFPAAKTPVDELGAMQEVRLDPTFDQAYRTFAERPDEAQRWLSREARQIVAALGKVAELKVKDGGSALMLEGTVCNPRALAQGAELLAAIQRGRTPRAHGELGEMTADFSSVWSTPAYVSLIGAFFLGMLLPVVPGLPQLASPLACDEGTLQMVWTSRGSGKSSGSLYCIDAKGTRTTKCVLPALLSFNAAYLPLMALLALRAAGRSTKEQRELERAGV